MLGVFNSLNGASRNAGSFRRGSICARTAWSVFPGIRELLGGDMQPDGPLANAVQRGMAELGDGIGLAEVGTESRVGGGHLRARPATRRRRLVDQIVLGWTGGPGGPVADGWLTMGGMGDAGVLMRDSIELDELRFPIRVEMQRIAPDTEGPGRRRGAPAAEAAITVTSGELDVLYLSDGTVNAPQGTRGGLAGAPAWQAKQSAGGPLEELELCGRLTLREGDTIYTRCCGGGGDGPPQERETDRVLADVHEGIITRRRAREVYGVDAGLQQNGA